MRGSLGFLMLLPVNTLLAVVVPQDTSSSDALLTRLAIETAADGDLAPIVHPPGPNAQFAVYDRFRLVSLAARAALKGGHPLDPASPPRDLVAPRTVILAWARSPLGDDPGRPQAIEITAADGRKIKRLGALGPAEVAKTLPGVTVPPQTLVIVFDISSLRPSDRVTIVFNDPPGGADARTIGAIRPGEFSGSLSFEAPKPIDTPQVRVPSGAGPASGNPAISVEGVLDLTGRVRYVRALNGPVEWRNAVEAGVALWRYSPARMGGVPVPLVMQTTVRVHVR